VSGTIDKLCLDKKRSKGLEGKQEKKREAVSEEESRFLLILAILRVLR